MPRKDDIRFDKRPVKVDHKSARGEIFRNFGAFTRGSQLVRMRYVVMYLGVHWLVLTALGCFAVLLIGLSVLLMQENEIQLVEMRLFAGIWHLLGLDPSHMINLTVTDGSLEPIEIGYVPSYPDVVWAVTKFTRCIIVAVAGSAVFTTPLASWFVTFSQKTNDETMSERHERGSTLVENEILTSEIEAHNADELAGELAVRYPDVDPVKFAQEPIANRIGLGIHVPYTIAGVSYPWRLEQTHAMLIGTTGTGKTTILRSLVAQARERGHRCVIFDLTGAFVDVFYREKTDVILNTMDARCPPWTLFDECENYADFSSAAAALIPGADGGGEDPFWVSAARTLFLEMCVKLVAKGHTTNAAIVKELMTADLETLCAALAGSIAAPLVNPKAPRLAESVRAVFNTNALSMRFLLDPVPGGRKPFSIRKWVEGDAAPGSILFITSVHRDLVLNRTLLTLWVDLAVNSLMTMDRGRDLRMWYLFDEVHTLHRLPAVEHGLQTARGFGGAFVLGMHSFKKLAETYGENGAHNLAALARTKVFLSTGDTNTAKFCSELIGEHEVREVEEAYSIGATLSRDAATITPRTSMKPLVLPDDIMNLQSLTGIVKFPEGFPAGYITVRIADYPKVAESFMRKRTMPIAALLQSPDEDDQSETQDSGPQSLINSELTADGQVVVEEPSRPAAQADLFAQMDLRATLTPDTPSATKTDGSASLDHADGTGPITEKDTVWNSFRSQRDELAREGPGANTPPSQPGASSLSRVSPNGQRLQQQISIEELTGQAVADPSEKKAEHHRAAENDRADSGLDDEAMGPDL